MLEEVEAPYEIKLVDLERNDQKSPQFLATNPMGKIPTIIHRNEVITEGAAICAYLADAFPEKGLAPALDDPKRGAYYRWLFFTASCLEPATLDHAYPRKVDVPGRRLGYGSYWDTVSTLEKGISNGFILGENFSAADVYVASYIGWCIMNKDIAPTPNFEHYLKLCSNRPGYQRYMEKMKSFT